MKGLTPSNAHRWGECPASVRLSQPFLGADLAKPYAEEGDRMHELCDALLGGKPLPPATEAELNEAKAAVEFVPSGGQCEVRFAVPAPFDDMKGRADYVHDTTEELLIADWKWGYTSVDAVMNPQLLLAAYALLKPHHTKVRMVIVQPRAFDTPVKEWTLPAASIKPVLAKWEAAFVQAKSEEPPCLAGDHCMYCPAAHACATLQQHTAKSMDMAASLTGTTPDELGRRLSLVEDAATGIKNMQRALEAHVESLLTAGTPVKGYELKDTLGHRQWNVPEQRLEGLAAMAGIDLYERKLVTPAEATRRGIPKGFQDTWTTRKSTKKVTKVKIV